MRIALLSSLVPADDDPRSPLCSLELAGRSLAARQLDVALELGCERIVCVAGGMDKPLIALQHQAEAAGAKFSLISGPRPLLGMITASDEIVAFADGLLPAAEEALEALRDTTGVLVLPVEAGVAAGFERIDLNHAWAGLLVMPGRLVERLSELPADCDTISALLRIALQGRVPERNLPESVLSEGSWAMIETRAQLAEIEPDWFRRYAAPITPYAPGRAMMRWLVGKFGGPLLGRRVRPSMVTSAGIAVGGLGVGVAWKGNVVAALALCGLGWLLIEAGASMRSLARAGAGDVGPKGMLAAAPGGLIDIYLGAVLVPAMGGPLAAAIIGPAIMLGLVRLAEQLITRTWAEFLQDRAVLAAILAGSAAVGLLVPAIETLSLVLLGVMIAVTRPKRG